MFLASLATLRLAAQGLTGTVIRRPEDMTMSSRDLNGMYKSLEVRAVAGRVMDMEGNVIRGAMVEISPLLAGEFRSFKTDASGNFQTLYM